MAVCSQHGFVKRLCQHIGVGGLSCRKRRRPSHENCAECFTAASATFRTCVRENPAPQLCSDCAELSQRCVRPGAALTGGELNPQVAGSMWSRKHMAM
ncbi:hypothetical protein MATL_G00228240 [Megalops atlanticus]|uniref:Uncharacterized protein n=1 Tax=Megalops atlanticus TaxID=7932 RepID=A0A9D3PCZ0_MEGAT|nr:hypothetical protein MATL_G00228240 [Megalops atlanticus]